MILHWLVPDIGKRLEYMRKAFILFIFTIVSYYFYNNYYSTKYIKLNKYELLNYVGKKNTVIFDLRDKKDFDKIALLNSINIKPVEFNEAIQKLSILGKIKINNNVILFGNNKDKNKINKGLLFLKEKGFNNIYYYKQGLKNFTASDLRKFKGKFY